MVAALLPKYARAALMAISDLLRQPSASAALPSFAVLARFVSEVVEHVGEIGFQLVDDLDDHQAQIHRRSLRAWR